MFDLKTFLSAQNCSWIARAHKLRLDSWRLELACLAPGNDILSIHSCDMSPESHPILHNIVQSYVALLGEFTKINDNYIGAKILGNPAFTDSNNRQLGPDFFGFRFFEEHKVVLRNLKYSDCFQGNIFLSVAGFRQINLPLPIATWMRLRGALLYSRRKIKDLNLRMLLLPNNIDDFFNRARMFRNILEKARDSLMDIRDARQVTTFANLTNTVPPAGALTGACWGSWSHSWIPSWLKMFIFKFRNNILPLTNRIGNFIAGVEPYCTLCSIAEPDSDVRESFSHCFFDCNCIHDLIYNFSAEFFALLDPDSIKLQYWYGTSTILDLTPRKGQIIITYFWDTFRYTIFRMKQAKIIPTIDVVKERLLFCLRTSLGTVEEGNSEFAG
jgi:hypothetical protein